MSERLDEIFMKFTRLSGAMNAEELKQMNSKACSKMVKDCLPREIENIVDTKVFPKYKEMGKPYMLINNFSEFVRGCAYEYAKLITENQTLVETAPEVQHYYNEFLTKLREGGPDLQVLNVTKTGNLDVLMETSAHTGSYSKRLDEGRLGEQATSGCVETTSGCVQAFKAERRNSKKVTFKMED